MATPPPPVSQAALTRRAVLVLVWIFHLGFLGTLCLVAAYVADERGDGVRVVTERPLAGALVLVPYVVTAGLLAVGFTLYRRLARPAPGAAFASWPAVQRAFFVLLAIYELGAVLGFVLLLARPTPAATFFVFASATFILLCVGLGQLMTTWPRE